MAPAYDDRLPNRPPLPKPQGWYEVFCCGTMVLVMLAILVAVALLH